LSLLPSLELMRILRRPNLTLVKALLFLVLVVLFPSLANAQLNSNIAGVNLTAVLTTSLTLSASPGAVNFNLVPSGVANGSGTVAVTTTWTLVPSVGAVTVWAYFSTAVAALSDGAGDNIPSSSVLGSPNGGAFAPFTGVSPFAAGSSLQIFTVRILGNNRTGTRVDNLDLRINTTGLNLPAGTYSGVMHIQAQAL
jgi:hypothetical protein